jgi:uncharacterized protein (DUF4415 family)
MIKKKTTKTDWDRLHRQGEGREAIDFSDIPELAEDFWKDAAVVIPGAKTKLTIRLDTDVYRWFTSQGAGYQTRMNAVLRSFMQGRGHLSSAVRETGAKYTTKTIRNPWLLQLEQLLEFCQRHPDPGALSDALKAYDKRHSNPK